MKHKDKKGNSMLRKLIILAMAAIMVAVVVVPAFASTKTLAVSGKYWHNGEHVGFFQGRISNLEMKTFSPNGEKMQLGADIEGRAKVRGKTTHIDRSFRVASQVVANCDNSVTLDVVRIKMLQKGVNADLALNDEKFDVSGFQGDHTLLKHALCSINDEMTPSQATADFANELFAIRGLSR